MTTDVISGIRTFTSKNSFPLLPMDLISTNQVLDGTISLLEDTLSSSENTTGASSFVSNLTQDGLHETFSFQGTGIEGLILLQDVLDVFNDLLSDINLEGWLELAEVNPLINPFLIKFDYTMQFKVDNIVPKYSSYSVHIMLLH